MKREIDIFSHANEILQGVKRGALLTAKNDEKVNPMTISWGMLGIEWGRPIFITFVRASRYTKHMLEETKEFTVCIPTESSDKKIGAYCGRMSGRDVDKVADLGLTLVESDEISVPGIAEYPLILECKLLYEQAQEPAAIPEEIRLKDYPQDVPSTSPLANRDYHTAFYAEIVKAYYIEK